MVLLLSVSPVLELVLVGKVKVKEATVYSEDQAKLREVLEQELEAQPLSELLVQVLEREELETLKAEMVFWLEEEQTLSEAKDLVSEALSLLVRLPLDWVLVEAQIVLEDGVD